MYLKCAGEIISRTKSKDCVRVSLCNRPRADDTEQCSKSALAEESEVESIPVEKSTNKLHNNNKADQHTIDSHQTPNSSCDSGDGDRKERRKEKKRRKKELIQQIKQGSTQTQTIRFTTTKPFDSLSEIIPKDQPHSIVHVKPLIVLDLNGILCHRVRRKNISPTIAQPSLSSSSDGGAKSITSYRPSLGYIANTQVIPRSDLDEFLTLLHNNFSLAVWTSATKKTAKILVRTLFPKKVRERLVFVWNRSFCDLVEKSVLESTSDNCVDEEDNAGKETQCQSKGKRKRGQEGDVASSIDKTEHDVEESENSGTIPGDEKIESNAIEVEPKKKTMHHDDLIAIKCLSKVWSSYPLWDATNTILLDDSPEKCPNQHRGNALHPRPICGTITCSANEEKKGDQNRDAQNNADNEKNDACSTIDDDEANQTVQRNFFQLLVNHWSQSTPNAPKENLMRFLEEHANNHNMGWELSSQLNADD